MEIITVVTKEDQVAKVFEVRPYRRMDYRTETSTVAYNQIRVYTCRVRMLKDSQPYQVKVVRLWDKDGEDHRNHLNGRPTRK